MEALFCILCRRLGRSFVAVQIRDIFFGCQISLDRWGITRCPNTAPPIGVIHLTSALLIRVGSITNSFLRSCKSLVHGDDTFGSERLDRTERASQPPGFTCIVPETCSKFANTSKLVVVCLAVAREVQILLLRCGFTGGPLSLSPSSFLSSSKRLPFSSGKPSNSIRLPSAIAYCTDCHSKLPSSQNGRRFYPMQADRKVTAEAATTHGTPMYYSL